MSGFNLAATSKEEQDRVAIDLVASGVAFKERLAMPVVAELVAREQPTFERIFLGAAGALSPGQCAAAGQKCPGIRQK